MVFEKPLDGFVKECVVLTVEYVCVLVRQTLTSSTDPPPGGGARVTSRTESLETRT